MIGIYCRECGAMWDAVFKEGIIINSGCQNKKNHDSEQTQKEGFLMAQESYPKAKFPEPWLDDHWYYAHDDVLDWFKRCITNYPHGSYPDIDYERIDWFNKWFSQFKDWEEFDWDKALEVRLSPTKAIEAED